MAVCLPCDLCLHHHYPNDRCREAGCVCATPSRRPALVIDWLAGNCPVQAEGWFDGVDFYFRARGSRWRVEVGHPLSDEPDWSYGEDYGTGYDAGWMSEDEARAFIRQAYERWRTRPTPSAATAAEERG